MSDLKAQVVERLRRVKGPDLDGNIVDLAESADRSFENAACLFSTFGMIRGEGERRTMLQNVRRILMPGGVFVMHAHNRGFHRLGLRRFWTTEFTMPQAYGGAPLTLRHFSKAELVKQLTDAGFDVRSVNGVSLAGDAARGLRVYGWLIAAINPG